MRSYTAASKAHVRYFPNKDNGFIMYSKHKSRTNRSKWLVSFSVTIAAAVLTNCTQQAHITPVDLMCEAQVNPAGIATASPRFSWKNESGTNGARQSSYQVLVASSASLLDDGKADLWNSGKVESSKSVWVEYAGTALKSRALAYWKVKVWDQDGVPSKWSTAQQFSVGLLHADDWRGAYIGMDSSRAALASPLLRKTVELEDEYDALYLHVNSLGYHELYINGQKVGDAVLAPAESQYDKRSFSLSYDVSPYLKEGKNAVVIWLGYGWYKHFVIAQ
jgi:alpha-L-rhamnosidase